MTPPRRAALIALSCFFLALASRGIARLLPQEIAGIAWKLGWLPFCLAGLWVAHRMGPRGALQELGLTGPVFRGLGVALLACLPMGVTLAIICPNPIRFVPATMAVKVLLAAFTEEILFRGYLFRQLHRRAGWGFAGSVLATALLFGLAHFGTAPRGDAMEALGVMGVTALGGGYFAWLLVRWNDNLWVPIGMHLFMNGCWELFAAGPDALGGWGANLARALAVAATVALTLLFTPRLRAGAVA